MDKKITTILVVGILVIAGAGVALVMLGIGGSDAVKATGNLPVYGNANNDDVIDQKDVDLMNKLLADDTISRAEYTFLDANQDGKFDKSDVELVQKIIKREKCEITYLDWDSKPTKQAFPVTAEKICINRYFFIELLDILGITDKLKLASTNLTEQRAGLYNLPADVVSYTGGKAPSFETIVQNQCDLVIADTWDTKVCNAVKEASPNTTIVYVDVYSYGNLVKFVGILGLLIDKVDVAKKYAAFVNDINDYLENGMKKVAKKEKLVIVHLNNKIITGQTSIEVNPCSSVILLAPLADVYLTESSSNNNRVTVDDEWVLQNYKVLFDKLLALDENYGNGLTFTKEVFDDRYEQTKERYTGSSIADDGNLLHVFCFTITFGANAYLPMVAHLLYPEIFGEKEGWDYLQKYWDDFSSIDVDVRTEGGWFTV